MAEEWRLQKISYKVTQAKKYEVAILPVGSTEPHGLHLPHGSDFFIVGYVADRICASAIKQGAKVILLPTIPYGVNTNTLKCPLAISVRPSVLQGLIFDVIDSLEHHGILKLIILNGHGGNEFGSLMREIYGRTKVFVATVDWWKVGGDMMEKIFTEKGDHADEFETSVNLEVCPELVHLEDARDGRVNPTRFEAINKGWAKIVRAWELLTQDTGYGDPRKATKEKGKQIVEIVAERIAKFVKELSDTSIDETFPFLKKNEEKNIGK